MTKSRRYHEATKYCPESILAHPGLDWDQKPPTAKTFVGARPIELAPFLEVHCQAVDGEERPLLSEAAGRGPVSLSKLSTLLMHTYGVTAVAQDGEAEHCFRASPSAGALYPNEIYIVTRNLPGIDDGLYNYQALSHSLVLVCEGDFRGDIGHDLFDEQLGDAHCAMIVSGVFYRSAWRYAERGYRRVLLDTGHLLGNAVSIAPALGLCASPRVTFDDSALANLLLVREEEEGVLAVLPLFEKDSAPPCRPSGASRNSKDPWAAVASSSPTSVNLHRGGFVDRWYPPRDAKPGAAAEARGGEVTPLRPLAIDWDAELCSAILLRRSARAFLDRSMDSRHLATILAHGLAIFEDAATSPKNPCVAEPAWFAPGSIETFVAIHDIDGIEPGLYALDTEPLRLRLLKAGDYSETCCHIALGQDIAMDAAAVVFHVSDLDELDARYGDRGYRYVGMDAGHIGQRMSHAAEALSLGSCGIGGYFDDQVNELFKLSPDRSVIYLTCLGAKG